MTILGVDFASVDSNRRRDYKAAFAAGVRFVILRGSYHRWADAVAHDADDVRAAGAVFGTYLFPDMSANAPSAAAQMEVLHKAVPLERGVDLPPTIDVEFPGGIAKTGRTRAQLLKFVHELVDAAVISFGVMPMLYTSGRVWDGTDEDSLHAPPTPELTACPLWLARYPIASRQSAVLAAKVVDSLPWPPVPRSWGLGDVWIHQYQGDAINFPGFDHTVDINRWNVGLPTGERAEWVRNRINARTEEPTVDAIKRFQRARGLVPDGIVGPKTFATLAWA